MSSTVNPRPPSFTRSILGPHMPPPGPFKKPPKTLRLKNRRDYRIYEILAPKVDNSDLKSLVGKVITGWKPGLLIPKKYSSYCIIFTVKDEDPILFVPTGPRFSRDVVCDCDLFLQLSGIEGPTLHQPKKIVEAEWRFGRFICPGRSSEPVYLVKLLGIKFEGMNDFGFMWSEFVNDGKFYCSRALSSIQPLRPGTLECENWGVAVWEQEHEDDWVERRN
ncbi:hypothetical protein TWF481_006306 [Arthrobotrys musiformis]|uniref:Uncharacterized protein n=1 Tax=Arthrobotrys musiformis TaxID=47236 RepID=A0AAV9WG95_9PEZI